MSEQKLSFRQKLGLMRYGYTLVGELTPGFMPIAVLRAVCVAAQPLVVLFFSARILNELSGVGNVRTIVLYTSITVGATFAMSVLRAMFTRMIDLNADFERVYLRVKRREAQRFANIDLAYAEDSRLNEQLAMMDVRARGNGLGVYELYGLTPPLLEAGLSTLFSLALLSGPLSAGGMSGPYTLIVWVLFALGLVSTVRMSAVRKKLAENIYRDNAYANSAMPYYMNYLSIDGAAKEIRLYNQASSIQAIIRKSFSIEIWTGFFMRTGGLKGVSAALLAAVGGAFYLLAGLSALSGQSSIGGVVQMVGAMSVFATAIGQVVMHGSSLYHNADFLKPYRDFDQLPDLLTKGARDVPASEAHSLEIEFKNVSFRYPGAPNCALQNLNLKLRAGQRLAVVGLNGSGKTTMIKLLCRLYDPDEGEILLGGVNIKEYDYEQYMRLFSVVFQDFALMPLELGKNVSAGNTYDEERVSECLKLAGFEQTLKKMPRKLDTMLFHSYDENGTQVSGGEAQKIALARALYRDAPIVILDEPTAALDPIAEFEIYSSFNRTIGGKTAVFISHRLSSCRFCHDIAVFEGGMLIERGGHEELLEKNGRYRELWYAQAKHYEEQEQ